MNHKGLLFPIMSFLLVSKATTALSNGARAMSVYARQLQSGKWSAISIQTAEEQTISHRQQLEKEGAMGLAVRPVKIIGERTDQKMKRMKSNDTKILHFQRHGQGFHNTICAIWRELTGSPVDLASTDPAQNPMLRPDVMDSPLTQVGRLQCLSCQDEASLLTPQLVLVSPLLRAIQSAELSWSQHRSAVPWVAHEKCREDLGLLVCNQRRTIEELQTTYPDINFSHCEDNEDALFMPDRQETELEKTQRVYDFLQYIRALPQTEIAIVGHSAWLFTMCNAVMEIEDPGLKSWFLTSEIRSMQVTFEDR
jgi:broad specificity phosphatase PhoE